MHILISGAGGLIGSSLVRRLSREGYQVTRLTRQATGPGAISWDPDRTLNLGRVAPIDAVIHLAGENIGSRWTSARKARIRNSRVRGTRLLSDTLAGLKEPPQVMISASATGIYGDRGDELLNESSPPGDRQDFLVEVCLAWEAAAEPARAAGIRVVHPRFGVVLSPDGGALQKLLPPFRLGLGGRQGSGSQWMSWVAIDDVTDAVLHLLQNDRLAGPVNVTAPEAVRNRDFAASLGRVLGRPTLFPVPTTALRLAFGDMAQGTILASARVQPSKLLESGYQFRFPELEPALAHVLGAVSGSSFPV